MKSNSIVAFSRRNLVGALLLCGIYVSARLWKLQSYNLWSDELISLIESRRSWGGLFKALIADGFQAPLFFVLLKVWIGIGGESLLWLRLLPVLTSFFLLVPLLLLCRELNLHPIEAGAALLLISVNGYLIYFSQELRPYSLFLLLTVVSLWLFVRFLNSAAISKGHLIGLVAVNTLLVYTHYFGWMLIGCEVLFLCLKKRQRLLSYALTVAFIVLLFSPWAYASFVRVTAKPRGVAQTLGWIKQPGWDTLISFLTILNGPIDFPGSEYIGLVLFGSPILFWAGHVLRQRPAPEGAARHNTFWLLSLSALLPVAAAFIVSQFSTQSVWVPRYLIFTSVPYILLVATAVYRLHPLWVRTVAMLLLVVWASVAGFRYEQYSARAIPWEQLVHRVLEAEHGEAMTTIYVFGNKSALLPLQFYMRAAGKKEFRVKVATDTAVIGESYFWAAVDESSGIQKALEEELAIDGYRVGERSEAGIPGKRLFLFPVWLNRDIPAR